MIWLYQYFCKKNRSEEWQLVNVSLVGFGRVGRDIFRQTLEEDNINIVSVSDTADKDNLIYLLKYDSIYGKLSHEINISDE